MLNKELIKKGLFIFITTFITFSIVLLVFGFFERRTGSYNEPFTWNEYVSILPELIIVLIILSFVLTYIIKIGEDKKQKEIEATKSRIEKDKELKRSKSNNKKN